MNAALGPHEHVFGDTHECALCGWQLPSRLPVGTLYGRGARSFCGEAELDKKDPHYTGLVERPPFVVEESIHAGWIDWNEANSPKCESARKTGNGSVDQS